jgi:hypothetical protein
MTKLIKIFFGLSNTTLATMIFVILLIQFMYSAILAGEVEYAHQHNRELSQLSEMSLKELGQIKVEL